MTGFGRAATTAEPHVAVALQSEPSIIRGSLLTRPSRIRRGFRPIYGIIFLRRASRLLCVFMQSRPMQVSVSVTNLNRVNQLPLTPPHPRNFSVMSVSRFAFRNQLDDVRLRCEFISARILFRITERQAFSLLFVCFLCRFISCGYKSRNFYLLARMARKYWQIRVLIIAREFDYINDAWLFIRYAVIDILSNSNVSVTVDDGINEV